MGGKHSCVSAEMNLPFETRADVLHVMLPSV